MRVGQKVGLLVAVLGVVAVIITGLGIRAMQRYNDEVQAFRVASQKAFNSERLNRLVTAVVMDARGIYAADSTKAAGQFATGMKASLTAMDQLLSDWRPLIEDRDRAAFEAVVKRSAEFKAFRLETARLGTEVSIAAANEQGNNEGNRNNRKQFQTEIDALTKLGQAELDTIQADIASFYESQTAILIGFAAVGILAAVAMAIWIGVVGIARPLQRVTQTLGSLSAGNLAVETPAKLSADEVGELWRTVGVFRDALEAAERARREEAERDTARREERRRELMDLAARFESEVGSVVAAVSTMADQVLGTAQNLSQSASMTQDRAVSVAGASEQTSSNVQSVASASEQLSASTAEIGRQIGEASHLISQTVERTKATETEVVELSQSAERVGAIVAMIRAIADQTNLLALNATIEAARAGEAGRGFAVVASEVKALANQTAKATQDIEEQMGGIQRATERTVDSIGEMASSIQSLDHISSMVAAAADEQNAATGEITRSIQEAAAGATQVASDITEVRHAAESSGHASQDLLGAARSLATQSQSLRQNLATFVAELRAA